MQAYLTANSLSNKTVADMGKVHQMVFTKWLNGRCELSRDPETRQQIEGRLRKKIGSADDASGTVDKSKQAEEEQEQDAEEEPEKPSSS